MLTRKFKKNMMGGASRTELPFDASRFNSSFIRYFNFYSKNETKKITAGSKEGIYVGFYDSIRGITFGNVFNFEKATQFKFAQDDPVYYIENNDTNIIVVKKFKLHIMSIMANYTLSNGHTLFTDLGDPINKLDLPTIIKILEIKEDEKAAPVLPPPTPPLQNDDMIELQIYREFGVKCTLARECHNKIKDNFFKNNNIKEHDSTMDEHIRNLYVNAFDYITGSEMALPMIKSKDKVLLDGIGYIEKAIIAIYEKLNKDKYFNGARTNIRFDITTILSYFDKIRKNQVNTSIEGTPMHVNIKIPLSK
jgi:hypothetical protein